MPQKVIRKLDAGQGMLTETISRFRVLAYPPMVANDFWRDATSGLLYRVQPTISTEAELRMVPILQVIDVQVEDRSHILYEYPFPNG
jgi:hypothetical protein